MKWYRVELSVYAQPEEDEESVEETLERLLRKEFGRAVIHNVEQETD